MNLYRKYEPRKDWLKTLAIEYSVSYYYVTNVAALVGDDDLITALEGM